jgi:Protein of unknown function (DUF5818)
MKKQLCSFLSLSTVALLLGVGAAGAQTQDPPRPGQAPSAQDPQNQQQPNTPPETTPRQGDGTADSANQTPVSASQTFTGTIAKSGDRFVLQETSGTTYDLDNQAAVKDFDGKKVKLHGVLDSKTNTIHITQQ